MELWWQEEPREIPGFSVRSAGIWKQAKCFPAPPHGRMLTEYKGENVAMREMRSHMAWYTKGMKHSAALRCEINQVETLEGLAALLDERMAQA